MSGLSLEAVFWSVPAAVTYQLFFVWLQMQGRDLRADKSEAIYRQLKKRPHA